MFDNMWVYYLFTPIPIASFCAGLIFRKKGYPYKKNLIAGIIVTLLLCVYGSYPFIFGEQFTESTALLVRAEQYLGRISLPKHLFLHPVIWKRLYQTIWGMFTVPVTLFLI